MYYDVGVDLQGMSGRTIAGDAHFFEDATTPAKVRAYLDSAKVNHRFSFKGLLLHSSFPYNS